MASTVRIRDNDKKLLETLINYIAFKTNKKFTQEEMIALLVKVGSDDKEKLLSEIEIASEENYDWQNDPIFQVKGIHIGKDASTTVDKELYNR